MADSDISIPPWQKSVGVLLLLAGVAFIIFDWSRFVGDFWPVDRSTVGPNLLAAVLQWAVILILAALFWPPARRAIHRFVDRKTETIKDHVTGHHQVHAADLAELRHRLDHIIAHSGIPEFGSSPAGPPPEPVAAPIEDDPPTSKA